MPNAATFEIPPVARLVSEVVASARVVVDPFARNSMIATHRNDLDPETLAEWHMDAAEFCDRMIRDGVKADAVLFDPPYSPRQIAEVYGRVGRTCGTEETQNAALYREVRDRLVALLKVGGRAISCGWNSSGFGKERGYRMDEILLVCHGGAHNDTIVVVETKMQGTLALAGAAGEKL
jgi:hypothetical protein